MRCPFVLCSGAFVLGLAVRIKDEQAVSADSVKVREGVKLARKHIRAWDLFRRHQLNQKTHSLEKTDQEGKRLMAVLPRVWADYRQMNGSQNEPPKDSGSAWSVMVIMVDLLMLVTAGALRATGGAGSCPLLFTVVIIATWFVFGFFTLGETKLAKANNTGTREMTRAEAIVKLTESFTSVGYGRSSPNAEEWVLKFSHALHTWVGTAVVNGYISVWFSALMDCVEFKVLHTLDPFADYGTVMFLRFLKVTVWFGAWVFIVFPLLFADQIDKSAGNYIKNVYFTIMTGTTIGYGDLNAGIDESSDEAGQFKKKSQLLMYTAGTWMPAAVELFGRFQAALKGDKPSTDIREWMCAKNEEDLSKKQPPCQPPPIVGQACIYFIRKCGRKFESLTVESLTVDKDKKYVAYNSTNEVEDCTAHEKACNEQLEEECLVEEISQDEAMIKCLNRLASGGGVKGKEEAKNFNEAVSALNSLRNDNKIQTPPSWEEISSQKDTWEAPGPVFELGQIPTYIKSFFKNNPIRFPVGR